MTVAELSPAQLYGLTIAAIASCWAVHVMFSEVYPRLPLKRQRAMVFAAAGFLVVLPMVYGIIAL